MFTGLVQALGTLKQIADDQLQISCSTAGSDLILKDLAIGDSVAVDGVCLTVEEILAKGFIAAVSPETLSRSTLGQQTFAETWVNLETSLRVGSKVGGHFVTGHVDGVGSLFSVEQAANSWEMIFQAPTSLAALWHRQIAPYIVPKGSIAVNGVSLTVAECDFSSRWFKVAVIPHTFEQTNLQQLKPGSWVNLEADILGKYVAKFLRFNGSEAMGEETPAFPSFSDITPEFLAEHGFM